MTTSENRDDTSENVTYMLPLKRILDKLSFDVSAITTRVEQEFGAPAMALAEKRKVSIATREQLRARIGTPLGVVVQRRSTGFGDIIDVYMPSSISVPLSRRIPVLMALTLTTTFEKLRALVADRVRCPSEAV